MKSELSIHQLPSEFFDERPDAAIIDTIVIHSMYNPSAPDPFDAISCKSCLDEYEVSAHYLIDRSGAVWQLVEETKRAWHAGKSLMSIDSCTREAINQYSIGIELFGTELSGFLPEQYQSLTNLITDICNRHRIRYICGHSDIAPKRKSDPWRFDWDYLLDALSKNPLTMDIVFSKNIYCND